MDMSQPLYTNKLITEKSPYLLLYAHTPVNWYPWGAEAFQLAASKDKPIFLSIGCAYSRWCRVMLQESYSNPEVAAMLNEYFINIKVDKEELPHLAKLYFDLAQMLATSGAPQEFPSWPLNVFLTPDLLPFFSANYISIQGKLGLPSFPQIIEKLHIMWEDEEEREVLVHQGSKIMEIASFLEGCSRKELVDEHTLKQTVEALYCDVDSHYGGVKAFPKRLPSLLTRFFLRYGSEYSDSRSLFFVHRSLDLVSSGGIRDHLDGGFFCCTIDDKWLIPCFEKRLIDNAFMALSYLEAWAYWKDESYRSIGKQIISYILAELYDPHTGVFYTSEHAENWGSQGQNYYTWSREEVRSALGENTELFCEYYGVSHEGFCNGRNILHIPTNLDKEAFVEKHLCSKEDLDELLAQQCGVLKKSRDGREKPFKDDLSITFNNGWMIATLVQAGRILGNTEYLHIAKKCGQFVASCLYKDRMLLRRWRDGEAKYRGGLEDYAAMILGALSLYESGCGAFWLAFAEELMQEVLISFRSQEGIFYNTDRRDTFFPLQQSQLSDGESISGNALICFGLLSLHLLTEKRHYLSHAEEILQFAQAYWRTHKFSSLGNLLAAQHYFSHKHIKLIISLGNEEEHERIFQSFAGLYLPCITIVWLTKKDRDILEASLPEYEHMLIPKDDQTTTVFYVLDVEKGRKIQDLGELKKYLSSL